MFDDKQKAKKKNEEKVLGIPLGVYKSNSTNQNEICKLIDLSNLLVKSSAFRFAFRMVLYLVPRAFLVNSTLNFFLFSVHFLLSFLCVEEELGKKRLIYVVFLIHLQFTITKFPYMPDNIQPRKKKIWRELVLLAQKLLQSTKIQFLFHSRSIKLK